MAPTLVRASLSAPLALKQVDLLSLGGKLGDIIPIRGLTTTPLAPPRSPRSKTVDRKTSAICKYIFVLSQKKLLPNVPKD